MNEGLITVRYTKAIYQLAVEDGVQVQVKNDMESLLNCIKESPEFASFLDSPLIKSSQKSKLANSMFEGKIHTLTLKFLQLLIQNKRETYLKHLCINYIKHYNEQIGVKEAIITTAKAINEDHAQEIYNIISKKFKLNVELSRKVDPKIIGGFILRIEDQQINASLNAQLNKIKRELINS